MFKVSVSCNADCKKEIRYSIINILLTAIFWNYGICCILMHVMYSQSRQIKNNEVTTGYGISKVLRKYQSLVILSNCILRCSIWQCHVVHCFRRAARTPFFTATRSVAFVFNRCYPVSQNQAFAKENANLNSFHTSLLYSNAFITFILTSIEVFSIQCLGSLKISGSSLLYEMIKYITYIGIHVYFVFRYSMSTRVISKRYFICQFKQSLTCFFILLSVWNSSH